VVLAKLSGGRRVALGGGWVVQYGLFIAVAVVLAGMYKPEAASTRYTAQAQNAGPNIFLIAVDTLRADYLPFYNPAIETKTPELEAFLKDAIQFEHGFSQASWTKASFGTIFSGMYPECHTATTKT